MCVKLYHIMKHVLIGQHPLIQKIHELINVVSDTAFNVLILGETGTGKEVVARLLHHSSRRRKDKFIKINCSALPMTLLESELFGYERGAFTGADKSKPGKFELASNGVIFLDEIGDMPPSIQAKLLQVIQSGEFSRLGGTRDVKVNSWVVSATNHDLNNDIEEGRFREDLYYRLNIIKIEIPPLRERKEDIPLLSQYFIEKYRSEFKLNGSMPLSPEMQKLFQAYHWPGNVRELSSTILRLIIDKNPLKIQEDIYDSMKSEGMEPPIDITAAITHEQEPEDPDEIDPGTVRPLRDVRVEASRYIEKKIILQALNMTGWNKKKAARILKISYKALFYKMDNFGIGIES
ncbi:sigma-54 interaction domain-containing protein [Thermodesulfobacteriota bacterium]